MKLISVYATSGNVGRRSIAVTMANQAARSGNQTLLVELDYIKPSVALTLGITHPTKNSLLYFERALNDNFFNVDEFIMKHTEIQSTQKDLSKVHQSYDKKLDYLIFPIDYDNSMFPRLTQQNAENLTERAQFIVQQFISNIHALNYDVVIFILPNDKEDIFSVPVILESDHIVNVIGPSLTRFSETKKLVGLFEKFNQEKWIHILNMASSKLVDPSDYKLALEPVGLQHVIPFEEQRLYNDLNAEIGAPIMKEKVKDILKDCGLEADEKGKQRTFKFLGR